MCSMPIERRMSSGGRPAAICSSSVSCECVEDAGWITSERASPTFASCVKSLRPSATLTPAAAPPLMPKTTMPPCPFGRYFRASSWLGSSARPG